MQELRQRLRQALTGLWVRAWRLELRVGGGAVPPVPLLRGVFGMALKSVDESAYQSLFVGGAGRNPRYLLRNAGVAGAPCDVDFILFSPQADAGDSVWIAWERAAQAGLGARRIPFQIVSIRPLGVDGALLPPNREHAGFTAGDIPRSPGDGLPARAKTASPLRLLRDNRLIEKPTLPDLALACLRRICILTAHDADALWADRQAWLANARQVPAGAWIGRRADLVRYSGSQQREVEMRGITGHLDLPTGPGPLAELLAVAPWLHLGKGTVMGMGHLCVCPAPRGGA